MASARRAVTGNPTEQYGIATISALSSLAWTAMRP